MDLHAIKSLEPLTTSEIAIFEKNTINEIHEIERNSRENFHSKKEELCQLVGSKYPVFLEIADLIMHKMKGSAHQATELCQTLRNDSKNLKQTEKFESDSTVKTSSDSDIQHDKICFIFNTFQMIWDNLVDNNPIQATLCYFKSIKLMSDISIEDHNMKLTLLYRHNSVLYLKNTIARACYKLLLSDDPSLSDIKNSLASLYLLQNHSINDLFHILLSSRTKYIECVFKSLQKYFNYTKKLEHGNKLQSIGLISDAFKRISKSIINSVMIPYYLFDWSDSDNSNCTIVKYLKAFNFTEQPEIALNRKNAFENYNNFFLELEKNIIIYTRTVLEHVKSGKHLSLLFSSIIDFLQIENSDWESACNILFQRKIYLWDTFFYEPFSEYCRNFVEYTFSTFYNSVSDDFFNKIWNNFDFNDFFSGISLNFDIPGSSSLSGFSRSPLYFLFETEYQEDLSIDIDQSSKNSLLLNSSKEFSDQFRLTLDDISYLIVQNIDSKNIAKLSYDQIVKCFQKLLKYLQESLIQLKSHVSGISQIKNEHSLNESIHYIERIIFLSRLVDKIFENCSKLFDSFIEQLSPFIKVDISFNMFSDEFKSISNQGFSIWVHFVTDILSDKLKHDISNWISLANTESNIEYISKVENSISSITPLSPSLYVINCIFSLFREIYRIDYGNFDSFYIPSHAFFELYNNIQDIESISISSRLQLIFDITFLFSILPKPADYDSLYSKITKFFDPIQWDAWKPEITKNVDITIYETSGLFHTSIFLDKSLLSDTNHPIYSYTPNISLSSLPIDNLIDDKQDEDKSSSLEIEPNITQSRLSSASRLASIVVDNVSLGITSLGNALKSNGNN